VLGASRLLERLIGRDGDECVHLGIDRVDPIEARAHQLDRRQLTRFEQRREFGGGLEDQLRGGHYRASR